MLRTNIVEDGGNTKVSFEDKVIISPIGLSVKQPSKKPYTLSTCEQWETVVNFNVIGKNNTFKAFDALFTLIKVGQNVYASLHTQRNIASLNTEGFLTADIFTSIPCQFFPINNYTDIVRINWYSLNDSGGITSANNNAVLRLSVDTTGQGVLTIDRTISDKSRLIPVSGSPYSIRYEFNFNKQRFNMNAVFGHYLAAE